MNNSQNGGMDEMDFDFDDIGIDIIRNAIKKDDPRLLEEILQDDPEIDLNVVIDNEWFRDDQPFEESDKTTLLNESIGQGVYCSKVLLENGADPNFKIRHSRTPLMEAVTYFNDEIFQLLIDKGANIHVRQNGKTLLDHIYETFDNNQSALKLDGIKRKSENIMNSYMVERRKLLELERRKKMLNYVKAIGNTQSPIDFMDEGQSLLDINEATKKQVELDLSSEKANAQLAIFDNYIRAI